MNRLIDIANKALHPTTPSFPDFREGDTIKVYLKEQERGKERIKPFEGTVIRRRGDNIANKTFSLRKVSNNVSVVYNLPLLFPKIDKIEVKRQGKVRRSRPYYLLERKGHAAKVKQRMAFKKKYWLSEPFDTPSYRL